tara:strand:- start:457 stop:1305 length:849 start_codon:yes stop_codon:yes gene_type:complete
MKTSQYYFLFLIAFLSCGFSQLFLQGETEKEDSINRLRPHNFENTTAIINAPMPELFRSKLGKILVRYYNEGLGGIEEWSRINSLKLRGTIQIDEGIFKYESIAKKPNKLKVRFLKNGRNVEITCNGSEVWRKLPSEEKAHLVDSNSNQYKNVIHSSVFSSFLLYPFQKGKTIRYFGTKREDGRLCHIIRVALETGFVLDYYIGVQSYREVKVVQNNHLIEGDETTVVFSNFQNINGLQLPFRVISSKKGKLHASLEIDRAIPNVSVYDWMFNKDPKSDLSM